MPRRPDDDEGFLGRWSRRKRSGVEIDAEAAPEATSEPGAEFTDTPTEPEHAPITPEELAALPKIEDLVAGSDIRGFLRPGVPRALKNAALRRMWMLTPAIRDHADPAVDYAWDWNTPGGVPGDGVAPSPERAAEMLRQLRERPAPPDETAKEGPETAPDPEPGTEPGTAAKSSADTGSGAQPEAEGPDLASSLRRDRPPQERAQAVATAPGTAANATDAQTPRTAACPQPTRRPRHGGARPG